MKISYNEKKDAVEMDFTNTIQLTRNEALIYVDGFDDENKKTPAINIESGHFLCVSRSTHLTYRIKRTITVLRFIWKR